jgi:hypothetical protein
MFMPLNYVFVGFIAYAAKRFRCIGLQRKNVVFDSKKAIFATVVKFLQHSRTPRRFRLGGRNDGPAI